MSQIDYDRIPLELRQRPQWVIWKHVIRRGETLPTKLPFQTNDEPAKSNNCSTWTSFDLSCQRYERGGYDGIGFMFSNDDPFVGIDLDGCRDPDTGVIADWARDIVDVFNTYTEVSPSGTGVKLFLRAEFPAGETGKHKKLDLPATVADRHPGIEVYAERRYFAVTGERLEGCPSECLDRQAEFDRFFERHWPRNPPNGSSPQSINGSAHSSILDRAEKYVMTIPGAVSGERGHDATFHVACVLRKGFDLTLDEALPIFKRWNTTCQPEWTEAELRHKLEDAGRAEGEIGQLLHRAADSLANGIEFLSDMQFQRRIPGAIPKITTKEGQTDLANARRFHVKFHTKACYSHPWKKWLVWDGTRWKLDDSGQVYRYAQQIADDNWRAARAEGSLHPALQHAGNTASSRGIDAMLKLAQAMMSVDYQTFDSDPMLFNCENGTLDLRTGILKPHDPADLITKLCPTSYHPEAETFVMDRFVESIWPSQSLVNYCQRFAGLCLTGDTREQSVWIFHGTGSNGKTVFINALLETLGSDYAIQTIPDLLMQRGDRHPTELADLFGKRLVVCSETESNQHLAEAKVKWLTGGDKLRARRMREDFWEFDPIHKLILVTNHKPRVQGDDHAIWRRLRLIPFEQRFWDPDKGETGPEDLKADKTLPAKLREVAEGVLAWAVRGCLDWQSDGLGRCETIEVATAGYRSESDVIGRFISECCLSMDGVRVKFSELMESFHIWAEDSGEELPSKKRVGSWLKDNGYENKQSGCRWYLGLALKAQDGTME